MPLQPIKFYYDFLNQSSRALYILLEASKVPYEAIPISVLKGKYNIFICFCEFKVNLSQPKLFISMISNGDFKII